jgi:Family of unknown function (DUF6448)
MRNRLFAALAVVVLLFPTIAAAHCDTMDGPVIAAAKVALNTGDIRPVLKWIGKKDEPDIQAAFARALTVRAQGPEAKDLADIYFFETLVRVHRAGEGAPYTGLQPAGSVAPAVAAADAALAGESSDALTKQLGDQIAAGIRTRFARVRELKKHADEDVEAGRRYVKAYVELMHYLEALDAIAGGQPQGHDAHTASAETHRH